MFKKAIYESENVAAVRYPRGAEMYKPTDFICSEKPFDIYGDFFNCENVIVTYGRLFSQACLAKESLSLKGVNVCILKLNKIKPIEKDAVLFAKQFKNVFFFEESMLTGGVGESFNYELSCINFNGTFHLTAIENKFVAQATVMASLQKLSLDALSMEKIIIEKVG